MTSLFFRDLRGNLWAVNKVMGFVKDAEPDNEAAIHFLAILEGGMSTEITEVLYTELTKSLIILESAEPDEA